MTATSQHDFHPGAEQLNAFAERALDERERGQVLAHLAGCARCRQIVVLAQDAAETDAVPEPHPIAVRPNAWWKRGRLVWVPTAALAAFTVASITVLVRHAERHEVAINIAQQAAVSGIGAATAPAPSGPVETAPKASRTESSPAEASAVPPKSKASGIASAAREPELAAKSAALPPAAPAETVEVALDQVKPEPARPSQRSAIEALPQMQTSAFLTTPSAPAGEQQKETAQDKKQIDTTVAAGLFAAKTAPPSTRNDADAAVLPNSSMQSIAGTPAAVPGQHAAQPAALGSFSATMKISNAAAATSPARAVFLPSGLAVLSITFSNHRSLAIDKAGALFVSDDDGTTWKSVTTQWTGRAVSVLTQKAPIVTAEAAPPASAPENAPGAAAGSASSPTTFFEIVNDKNEKWWSTDGLFWIAK